jgi:hypothetical protein
MCAATRGSRVMTDSVVAVLMDRSEIKKNAVN